ncbi:MAG TPA: alpha/beta fold hydrolase [Mycobacterium sp.]
MSVPTIISVNGRRTRVRVEGDPADTPMLLLHGIGRSLEDWAPQYPRLARSHRVIAVDVPGFGFSARPPEPITLKVLARSVIDILDTLGERRPLHVVGNSLGGAIAQQLLVLDPDRVASLVLVNSAGFNGDVALALRLLALPVLGRLATRRTTRTSAWLTERMLYADPKLATKTRIDHALAIAGQPDAGPTMLETARELLTLRGIKPRWRSELLAEVAKHPRPTLIIWGDRDRILPPHHLNSARRLIPHAQTHLFTGIGHAPQVECPDAFAARVSAFVAETAGHGPRPTKSTRSVAAHT